MIELGFRIPSYPFDLQAPLTRSFVWEVECLGATFRLQTLPPEGESAGGYLEFWLTRIDIPDHAQLTYRAHTTELLFMDARNHDLVDLALEILIAPCILCKAPAISEGPCLTGHGNVCEMCFVRDEQGSYAAQHAYDVEDVLEHVATLNKSIKNGFRFTLLIQGVTHENCPATCKLCDAGFGDDDEDERYAVYEHRSKVRPTAKTVERHFRKEAFVMASDVDVMDTTKRLEQRQDELKALQKRQRDYLVAKDATNRALEWSERVTANLMKTAADTRTPPARKRN